MKLSIAALGVLVTAAYSYSLNDLSDRVNCRESPTTDSAIVKQYGTGDVFDIPCQVSGNRVFDYAIWDKTSDNCYIADYYVETGANSAYVTGNCLYQGPNPGPMVDDYRYKGQCDGVDPWNFYNCQCVSFVAQRINERQGIYFTNRYKGFKWGNANTWAEAGRNSPNVTVDMIPKAGCIAQHTRSELGHVAWVHSVDEAEKTITIEEYNVVPLKYSTNTVPWDAFDAYIHLDCAH
ncbi:hypothetical protein GGF46_005555 [Coemansia sp. RSA 552]|nr:hypothetical protein GGF46_005555 [Coemansia sp. RSA 552]